MFLPQIYTWCEEARWSLVRITVLVWSRKGSWLPHTIPHWSRGLRVAAFISTQPKTHGERRAWQLQKARLPGHDACSLFRNRVQWLDCAIPFCFRRGPAGLPAYMQDRSSEERCSEDFKAAGTRHNDVFILSLCLYSEVFIHKLFYWAECHKNCHKNSIK